MSGTDGLERWLRRLDEAGLVALLERRPDVLLGAPPRDLTELAQRLGHPHSLVAVLRACPLPYVQLAEAAQALGDGCTRSALARFLDGDGPEHHGDVNRIVDELTALAVITARDSGRIDLPDALAQNFPDPLGLGPPLAVLLRDRPVDTLRRIQTALGLARQKNRADTLAALSAYLGDGDNVRSIVASAPAAVSEYLTTMAEEDASDDPYLFEPRRFQQRQAAVQWAGERGLMFALQYGYGWQVPAEVNRALRGPDYRAPFAARRPEPAPWPADPGRVETDSAAAATQFADHALAVLDHVVRSPIPSVKAGGVGARELARLAKASGAGDVEVRLSLELADAAGLLDHRDQTVAVADGFAEWRDADPGERFATLLSAWWSLGSTPTEARDYEGKTLRAVARPGHCDGCLGARVNLIETLADVDGATSLDSLVPAALWRRPFVHVVAQDEEQPFATVWHEAELLGVIAQGALTRLGRLLLAGDDEALRAHADTLLPRSADRATFGADLTVYVAGAPAAAVSALLDSAADRESRGGAVTWRFSPASVRRALDDGTTADELSAALAQIATAELPQPLRYLIADVGRRHGNLRLSSVASCIRSADEALLAEVAANRKLAKLQLRALAPTVLASDAAVPELLKALRGAGYFPVSEDRSGNVVGLSSRRARPPGTRRARRRTHELAPEPRRADPRAAAAALLHRDASQSSRSSRGSVGSLTERTLAVLARSLSTAEVRQLAHAIDTKSRVSIEYQSASGGITHRVIDRPELMAGSIYAWCELRQDDRIFTVDRIRSVVAV